MITHRSVMTSSLRIKIFKFDKFGDFSSDIDYNSRTDVFRDVVFLIINQFDPRRQKIYYANVFVLLCSLNKLVRSMVQLKLKI